ncbi:MAG: SGNH/GDSL hydrolase family protein [Streptosporangiaceae bacterium]
MNKGTGIRTAVAAFALVLAVGLALLIVPLATRHAAAASVPASTASAHALSTRTRRPGVEIVDRDALNACESELERTRSTTPLAAILGASYTAGVGPDDAARSWAVDLARKLHWDAVVYGVPGAGYVRAGSGHRGPLWRILDRIELSALDPSLVVIQLGHDDIGVPSATERQRVTEAIKTIRAEDPGARIALVTVFTTPGQYRARAAWLTDRAIVSAARAADKNAIVIDPLVSHWVYPRADGDGLHPTAAGDEWIAAKVAALLRDHGVRAASSHSDTVICDSGIVHDEV